MEQSQDVTELFKALNKFQSEVGLVEKDSVNPYFKSHFASLGAIWTAIRVPLTKNGLGIIQGSTVLNGGVPALETMLVHVSGQWVRSLKVIAPVKMDPQGLGSAESYAKRYALSAVLGIVTEDDVDGEDTMVREDSHGEKATTTAELEQPEGEITFVPWEVKLEEGKSARGPWTKYKITNKNGNIFGTFSKDFGTAAQIAKSKNDPVTIKYKTGKYGPEVVDLVRNVPVEA